ncbi:MAG: sugar fermentation stimulation protein A [Planctomycetota bacterium]|jgi:sugar fermentation stimulation protein A
MIIEQPTVLGVLRRRYKRFLADVELPSGEVLIAHCPNTGSMQGCSDPGSRVVLRDSQKPERKLKYTLQTIEVDGTWVNVDTGLPNALVPEAIVAGLVPDLGGYDSIRREVKYGKNSRIDALLEKTTGERCYVEVKNTTLARGELALFPDAVTERGRKHLVELMDMVTEGHRAVMFYVVSRADVNSFAPADDIDPVYGKTLREAIEHGVEILAYSTVVQPTSFELGERLSIEL